MTREIVVYLPYDLAHDMVFLEPELSLGIEATVIHRVVVSLG